MMALRFFFALSAVVLFVAVANAALAEEAVDELELSNTVDLDDQVEARNPALAVAIRIIAAAVRWAAKHCIKEAALHCKQHWKNPGALISCGKSYLQSNKGRCLVG